MKPFTWWVAIAYACMGTVCNLIGQPEHGAGLAAWAAFFMALACYDKLASPRAGKSGE